MKKSLFTLLSIALVTLLGKPSVAQTFDYPLKGKQGFNLTEKTRDGLHISYNVGQVNLNQINYRGEEMSEVSIKAMAIPSDAGKPNLPADSRMMAIPQGATATLHVVSFDKEVIHNVNIAPALRIQSENEEPDMNYVKDMSVYGKDAYYPAEPFVMGSSYIRGVEAVTVAITPFQYNPVTKDLIVYTNVELSVTFEGGNGHFGEDRLRSPYWDPILAAELLNYDQLPVIDYEARMQKWLRDNDKGAEYLIITPNNDAWTAYANQLKDYRTRQGIITQVYRLDEMPATNTAQMKSWFHSAYNTWEIAPVAICLLGDHGTNMGQYVPAETVPHPYGSCITDNGYADVVGNDNLPDMVFSRLIAETPEQLPVFVGKQIEYEYTNPNMDPNFYTRPITALGWQTERWFQICSEVFGGYMRQHGYDPNRINCIYQGTPGGSWSSNQNTSMVVNYFGPSGVGYIPQSPSELGGWNNGTPEMVVQAVNEGSFWLQHRDHGEEHGWGEPAVKNSHVAQMNNVGKLPFVMSINCLTGKYNYSDDCFAEAWMRRTYNGENAGAVGILCPTETSYSFVNDAYVWGVYDLFDGNFMPDYGPYAANTGNWMPAFGNVAGKYFLAQSSWPYNTDDKDITYTMFTAHCDAFLRIYTQVPQEMDVVHPEVVIAGYGEVNITAPEGCMISLVKEDPEGGWEILAVAEATGNPQNIEIVPQLPPTEIHLVVTGQNYLRYEAVMGVIPADGPYIVFDNKIIHDHHNENQQLDFGESIDLDVRLKNVGSDPMEAFEAVLETESEYITITNNTAQYGSLEPNATEMVANAFSFNVADNVPDNTSNHFTITVTNGDEIYTSNLVMKAYAPVFDLGNMHITEVNGNGNGRLDAGETAQLSFPLENKGHADAASTIATLQILSPYIIVEENTVSFDNVNASETKTAVFDIAINENTPIGYACPLVLTVTSGQYNAQNDYTAKVGLIIEDFENGELGQGWSNDPSHPWRIVSESPYEGQFCVRSGAINNNNSTSLILSHEAGSNDTISFYYKVSSETNWDKLHFYIDGQEKGNWSGNIGWTKASYPVSEGRHSYKWTYAKDASQSSGSDCAWIDFISLPAARAMAGTAGYDVTVCEGNDAQIVGYAIHYNNLQWTTSGDGTFDDAGIATPIYTPGTQDLINREVTLTITINGNGETITDEMTVFINDNVVIDNALLDYSYCAVSLPQEVAVLVSDDNTPVIWSTSGDGVFEDAHELSTYYTPGPMDVANGEVTILATAQVDGCDPVVFEYPFDMNPAPSFTMGIIPPCVFEYCQGQDVESPAPIEFSGFIDGQMTITINDETYPVLEGEPFLMPTATLEPGYHILEFQHLSNGLCEIDLNNSISFYILEAPNLTVDETYFEICQGESVDIVLHASGGNPNYPGGQPFSVNGEGIEPITIIGDSYTLTLTPEENTEIHLTRVVMENPNCGGNCETELDLTISVNVNPFVAVPEISGDAELDVRLTPNSTYTIANDVPVTYSLEPEEAGTLAMADDGKTVEITWSDTYKGEVVLTALPLSSCNNGNSTKTIDVKNSTDVNEFGVRTSLYPNPTNGNVTIEAEGMQRLSVVNELGQVVYDAEVSNDTETLNMSQFGVGVYMIRIYTENGMGVKRVSVIR